MPEKGWPAHERIKGVLITYCKMDRHKTYAVAGVDNYSAGSFNLVRQRQS